MPVDQVLQAPCATCRNVGLLSQKRAASPSNYINVPDKKTGVETT
jgi:hypothetical protein